MYVVLTHILIVGLLEPIRLNGRRTQEMSTNTQHNPFVLCEHHSHGPQRYFQRDYRPWWNLSLAIMPVEYLLPIGS